MVDLRIELNSVCPVKFMSLVFFLTNLLFFQSQKLTFPYENTWHYIAGYLVLASKRDGNICLEA